MADLKYIGLDDKNGNPIHVGDKVVFHWDEHLGYSEKAHPDYTMMIDEVIERNGEFYFFNHDVGNGGYASRHNKYCTVAGRWDQAA